MPDMVCDTGPLQRLHRGGVLDVLHALYTKVLVPRAVAAEIERGRADGLSLPDLAALAWIEVRDVRDPDMISVVTGVGPAERAALTLSMETTGSVLVTDEVLVRRQAKMLRQPFTGTIGVLIRAKQRGVIPRLTPVVDLLDSRGFRFLPDARSALLTWVNETR